VSADPAVLFKGARSVVAEELAKVKQGFEAAPLDVLVKRARLQLERDGEATPVSDPPMPVFPARPAPSREAPDTPPSRASGAAAKKSAPDDPFQDVASRAELNWEKEIPIQAEDAPFRSAILPIPRKARGPLEISQPIDAPHKAASEIKTEPAPARKPHPELELDFAAPSKASAAFEPPAPKPKAAPPEPAPAAFEPPAPKPKAALPESTPEIPMSRPAVASAPAIPLVNPRELEVPEAASRAAAPSPSVPKTPVEPLPPPSGPERFLRAPTSPARYEPPVKPMTQSPPQRETLEDHDDTQPAMEEFRFKAAERPAPAPVRVRKRASRTGWIAVLLGVIAVGAALAWAVREGVFKSEVVRKATPVALENSDVAPPASAPAPAPTDAPPVLGKPAALPPRAVAAPAKQPAAGPSSAEAPKGRAAVLLTPDWAGKPVVYVIHFSSTKDRESAAKEAQKLGAALGAPARAVEVDLGEKGIWYRVVVGEFKDVDAARAFRADLEAKKTPGMGFVYEMRGR
ncbi:MAG TPA: SPOR domain-containing protein, partial [Thermoanaerobaculia bacterium]|nr:SPOR domain-containing protein [Thermoanaerobaculia bacterium]